MQIPKTRLFHYWRSSSSWRVRWAFALKNIPCEFVAVNLLSDEPESPDHLKRNPMGFVPVLEFLERSEDRFLGESVALIEWAERVRPTPSLFPKDLFEQARSRQLAEIINAGTQPLQNPTVSALHSADPTEQKKWNQYWIRKGLNAFQTLAQKTAGKFSIGDELSLADLFLIPQCYNAMRQEVLVQEFPLIEKIYLNALETESCRASHPDRFNPGF